MGGSGNVHFNHSASARQRFRVLGNGQVEVLRSENRWADLFNVCSRGEFDDKQTRGGGTAGGSGC